MKQIKKIIYTNCVSVLSHNGYSKREIRTIAGKNKIWQGYNLFQFCKLNGLTDELDRNYLQCANY